MGVHTLIHKITCQNLEKDCVYLPGEVWLCQHARGDNHILSIPSTNSHTDSSASNIPLDNQRNPLNALHFISKVKTC